MRQKRKSKNKPAYLEINCLYARLQDYKTDKRSLYNKCASNLIFHLQMDETEPLSYKTSKK